MYTTFRFYTFLGTCFLLYEWHHCLCLFLFFLLPPPPFLYSHPQNNKYHFTVRLACLFLETGNVGFFSPGICMYSLKKELSETVTHFSTVLFLDFGFHWVLVPLHEFLGFVFYQRIICTFFSPFLWNILFYSVIVFFDDGIAFFIEFFKFMCMFVHHVCMCVCHMSVGVCGGQNKVWNLLDLESQVVVRCLL